MNLWCWIKINYTFINELATPTAHFVGKGGSIFPLLEVGVIGPTKSMPTWNQWEWTGTGGLEDNAFLLTLWHTPHVETWQDEFLKSKVKTHLQQLAHPLKLPST